MHGRQNIKFNRYYIFWVCVCAISYPASNAHAPYYIVICGLPGCITFYHITYLLTPWCRVLLEKLTGLQLVKKFPAFYGTRSFITALTSVRHLSLSWASPIQSTYSHPTSWRSILILSTHLRLCLPSDLFPSGFYITFKKCTIFMKSYWAKRMLFDFVYNCVRNTSHSKKNWGSY